MEGMETGYHPPSPVPRRVVRRLLKTEETEASTVLQVQYRNRQIVTVKGKKPDFNVFNVRKF